MFSILYYSATGNTLHLVNQLSKRLDSSCIKIIDASNADPTKLHNVQHLIIMYPIHAFNAPKEIIEFVKEIPCGLFEKVSIIAIGCNNIWINDANSLELRKILNKKGYEIALDRVLVMPLTIAVKFSYDTNYALIKEAEKQILHIGDDLINGVKDIKTIPLKSKLISNLGKCEKHAVKLFGIELYANKDCISCGMCWKQCPSNNIYSSKDNLPKFKFNCSMCMKCIYNCPTKAISPRFSKFLPIKDGYRIKDYL